MTKRQSVQSLTLLKYKYLPQRPIIEHPQLKNMITANREHRTPKLTDPQIIYVNNYFYKHIGPLRNTSKVNAV